MKGLALAVLLAALPAAARAEEFYQVADGRYAAILGDCEGCHTAPGGKPFTGGLVLQTPFGKLAVPNITPDRDTGIGNWSAADFERAMRHGIAPGGKRLYPAMPYPAYARLTDQDVAALFAYLRTLTPVRHAVETNLLPYPFRLRGLMAAWDWLYFKPAAFAPTPGKSAAWNRGAYLVTGPGHCGTCHTPKGLLGADSGTALTGASLAGWFAPEITNGPRGLGGWSAADIATYLRSGWNSHAAASGPMAEVVEHSTSKMTDADRLAIAVYLKDQPGEAISSAAPDSAALAAGKVLYQQECVGCHGWDGKGQHLLVPPLGGNPAVIQASGESLARVVLAGAQAVATKDAPTQPAMPSFAWRLSDDETADLITYIRNSFGNSAAPVAAGDVRKVRASLAH